MQLGIYTCMILCIVVSVYPRISRPFKESLKCTSLRGETFLQQWLNHRTGTISIYNSLPFLCCLKLMAEEDRGVLLPRTDSPRDASSLDQRPGQWQWERTTRKHIYSRTQTEPDSRNAVKCHHASEKECRRNVASRWWNSCRLDRTRIKSMHQFQHASIDNSQSQQWAIRKRKELTNA